MGDELEEMSVEAIMRRWPSTVRVFIDWRLHCIGCPIADFHRLADTAREHGYLLDDLKRAIRLAVSASEVSSVPPRRRRR
jgi:hybrid cluster-associated redox disulfide protein